jgi:SAM-dependent methyltransferase
MNPPDNHVAARSHSHEHSHRLRPHSEADEVAMGEILDLDAEVLQAYLSEVVEWILDLAGEPSPHRILDLGSGTGTGTFALLAQLADLEAVSDLAPVEITAVDASAAMLGLLSEKARTLGVADHVHTVQVDLDVAWPVIGAVDLVWASSSLHHLADPDHVLTEVYGALRRGGLLAVAEMDSFPRFLPDDLGLGRPGLEDRCHDILDEGRAAALPHLGADWGARLTAAGFAVEGERPFVINLTPPLPSAAGHYAEASLRRIRSRLEGRLDATDLTVLDALLESDGPQSVRRRSDLTIRTTRTVWAARRP